MTTTGEATHVPLRGAVTVVFGLAISVPPGPVVLVVVVLVLGGRRLACDVRTLRVKDPRAVAAQMGWIVEGR